MAVNVFEHGNMAVDCEGRELTDERIANAVRTLAQWLEREPDGSVLITRGDEMGPWRVHLIRNAGTDEYHFEQGCEDTPEGAIVDAGNRTSLAVRR